MTGSSGWLHHVEGANQLPVGGDGPQPRGLWGIELNHPDSPTALVTHGTGVSTCFTRLNLPSGCRTLNHLDLSYYSARVIEPVPLHPGQHPGSWTELWTQAVTGQHAGEHRVQRITQTAPGQRQEGSSRWCPTSVSNCVCQKETVEPT